MAQEVAQVKVKKSVKSTTTPKVTVKPSHPKFIDMIVEGLKSLNERTGSSRQALYKFIMAKYQLDEKVAKVNVKLAIKNGVKNGSLKQLKGVGSNGSFKIGDALKNEKKSAVKKVVKKTTEKKPESDKPKKNIKKIVKPKLPKSTESTQKVEPKKKVVKETAKPKVVAKPAKKETVKKAESVKKTIVKKTVKKTPVKKVAKN